MASSAIRKYQKQLLSLRASTKRAREKAGEVVTNIIRTAEVAGTGFGFGLLQGYRPDFDIFGVPPDLAVGLGAHLFNLFGAGNAGDHLLAVGDGALTSYAHTVGRGLGASRGGGVSGEDPYVFDTPQISGDELDLDDLAGLESPTYDYAY